MIALGLLVVVAVVVATVAVGYLGPRRAGRAVANTLGAIAGRLDRAADRTPPHPS